MEHDFDAIWLRKPDFKRDYCTFFFGIKNDKILRHFESSGNTGLAKCDYIKIVVARNRLENPIYIGDTQWHYEAAEKANIPFTYAAYCFGQVENWEWKIESFTELTDIIDDQQMSKFSSGDNVLLG